MENHPCNAEGVQVLDGPNNLLSLLAMCNFLGHLEKKLMLVNLHVCALLDLCKLCLCKEFGHLEMCLFVCCGLGMYGGDTQAITCSFSMTGHTSHF